MRRILSYVEVDAAAPSAAMTEPWPVTAALFAVRLSFLTTGQNYRSRTLRMLSADQYVAFEEHAAASNWCILAEEANYSRRNLHINILTRLRLHHDMSSLVRSLQRSGGSSLPLSASSCCQ